MIGAVTDNIGTFLSALGLCGALAGWLLDRFVGQRRRVTYRVHLDAPVGVTPASAGQLVDIELRRDGNVVPEGRLALVRVKNAGRLDVSRADVENPLTFTFANRTVLGVDLVEAKPSTLRNMILQDPGLRMTGTQLVLPKFSLNRGDGFKLLILLSGGEGQVVGEGFIRGGKLEKDTKQVGVRSVILGGICLVLSGLLLGLLLMRHTTHDSAPCAEGQLLIEGSSAFTPLVERIADTYHDTCGNAHVSVRGNGSLVGVRDLATAGETNADGTAVQMAVSDGPAPAEFQSLVPHPIGIVVFTMVLNRSTGLHDLTVGQVRDVYTGRVTNWNQLGGADLPVRLISRGSESGTRGAFERRVLKGHELAVSSDDCLTKDRDSSAAVIRCEIGDTAALLQAVDRTPGAVGYAELSATARYANIDRVKLDSWDADITTVQQKNYPFWEVEYFYTHGTPAGDTLASAFLRYLALDVAKNILRGAGYTPCVDRDQNLMNTQCRTG